MLPEDMTFLSKVCRNLCFRLRLASDIVEGSSTYRERQKDRDLMDVSASADKLPPERLLVAIETTRRGN